MYTDFKTGLSLFLDHPVYCIVIDVTVNVILFSDTLLLRRRDEMSPLFSVYESKHVAVNMYINYTVFF